MKKISKIISVMSITTIVSLASSTPIIDSGIGSELDKIKQALKEKENKLTVTNNRVLEIERDINKSKQQIIRYKTLQTERVNVEAACRNQREQFKIQNLWKEPMAQEKDKECFRELIEEIPVYKKLAQYATSLLVSMKKLATEAKILGINAPVIEATITKLKAHKALEDNR